MAATPATAGAVTGAPRMLLRAEGAAVFAAAAIVFFWQGNPWWLFALLFLAPDLSFLAYFAGPRVGAAAYNTVHTTLGPLALVLTGLLAGRGPVVAVALIWAAHVGLDRALGYGLKYGAGFGFTHLESIGRRS